MTEKTAPEALQFANSRPRSIDGALYRWAMDAELWIRRLHAENKQLKAQLAQRERPALTEHFPLSSPSCWCESCDKAANGGFRSRMSICPSCRDKRCQRSIHHVNACDKERAHGIGDPT
ncbi:MAG: hypothetical protein LBE61_00310 [Burkholderiaceae bacterium]|nr:hypothetical protein [Burkholderiaceae bacterium]